MAATVDLVGGDARVVVVPSLGGAVASFAWRGRDLLRPTPPVALADGNVRLCASFPLVPFSNRIADARLAFRGAEHPLHRNLPDHPHAIHGVGFQRPWAVTDQQADRVTLALDYHPDADPARAWPFAFRALQRLAVGEQGDAAALTMSLALENTDTHEFPFGLGWHPYFPRSPGSVLSFAAKGVWETGPTLLPTRHVVVPPALSFDPPRAIGATTMDHVFTGVRGAVRLDDPARDLRVEVEGDGATPFLVVFVPPGRDFCAIEPVTHMTDAFNRDARGEPGTGTRTLAPGAGFCCTMRILAQPLGSSPA